MPVFTIETPRGRKVKIEAADQATAIRGAERWDLQDHATSEAKRLGVDPGLVIAVGEQESGWNPGATSPKGARGAMQLMPATARELGVNPDDPYENITGGVTYLRRQLDTFGDERKALAAYNAGPGAVQQYGGVPPFRETQAYVEAITSGRGGEVAEAEMTAGPVPRTPPPGVLPPPMGQATPVRTNSVNPAEVAALATRPSFGLGVQKGAFTSVDNVSSWLQSAVRNSPVAPAMADQGRALRSILPEGLVGFIDNPQAYYDEQRRQGRTPSKVGEFVGNVAGTSWIPGGPFVQAGLGGAVLSQGDTPFEVGRDALVSGLFGKGADLGLSILGPQAAKLLAGKAKPDEIMTLARNKVLQDARTAGVSLSRNDAEVQAAELAKRALYKAVDDSGFRFNQGAVDNLVRDFQAELGKVALSKEAKANAQSIITYAKTLKDPSLSQLEKLRGDIYEALSKKGGDNAVIGGQFRQRIDGMIDAVDNGLVRQARAYNARFKKADKINRSSQSADLNAERTYGGDYGRKLKDRVAPLVDPLKPQSNFRGGTPDEIAALNKLARGTPTQKVATEIGALTDPRRMGGKILAGALGGMTGTAGIMSGGASLPLTMLLQAAQIGTGLGATGLASNIARNNLEDLIKLITSGGSRQASARVPTAASQTAQKVVQRARPAAVVAVAPALAASREPKAQNRKPPAK